MSLNILASFFLMERGHRRFFLVIFLLTSIHYNLSGQQVGGATSLYTDFNGFWYSGVNEINPLKPDNNHNLLGFTWKEVTYSTGVNDPRLDISNVVYTPSGYQAFPVRNIESTASTFIAFGQLSDGVNAGSSDPPPFPVPPNLPNFLTDGLQGLDIGTGVANIRMGELIFDFSGLADSAQIADGIPDIVVSQIADPNSALDEIYFTDSIGNQVGESVAIDHTIIDQVGEWTPDFYNMDGTPSPYINGNRFIRLWVAELSAFGIDMDNYDQVKSMRYKLKGFSDPAFIAYKLGVFDILTANNDEAVALQDEEVQIDVLENDQPVILLDPSSVNILNIPSNGTASIDRVSGNITYTPDFGFLGIDEFTYEVCSNNSEYYLCDLAVVEVSVQSVILPIVLLHFSVTLDEDNNVLINWVTGGEIENNFFEVQHSSNGVDWKVIAKIEGAGNTTQNLSYTIIDRNPENGFNYYQLKQVDIDGDFELFDVVSVMVQHDIPLKIKIYPNPSPNVITLEGDPSELDYVLVIHPPGQILNTDLEIKRISDAKIYINLENIPSGIYIVKTRTTGNIIRKF